MELPHVWNCGVYRTPQTARQRLNSWLILNISGMKRCTVWYPDGTRLPGIVPETPHILLAHEGFVSSYEYGPGRENWVLMLDFPAYQYDPEEHALFLRTGETRCPLNAYTPVRPERIPEMRERFRRIVEAAGGALPADCLRADLLTAGLFSELLGGGGRTGSVADEFKARLDRDRAWCDTMSEHSRALGKNPTDLRREFRQRYGMAPYEYRDRLRRSDILSLMTYSELSLKEIADRLGLRHVQHLNLLVRKYFGCSPKELKSRSRQYRVPIPSRPI